MAEIGQLFLMGALALSVFSIIALVVGTQRRLPELVTSGHTAAWAVIGLCVGTFLILEYLRQMEQVAHRPAEEHYNVLRCLLCGFFRLAI